MAKLEYIKIRYNNDCDNNSDLFSTGQYYDIYLDGVIGEPEYEHIENTNENDAKEVEFTRKTLKKSIKFITVGDEWIADCLNKIRLLDNKVLTTKSGVVYNINEMDVESELAQGVNIIKMKFIVMIVTNTKCCNNYKVNDNIQKPNILIDAILASTDAAYLDPKPYAIGQTVIVTYPDGSQQLLKRAQVETTGLPNGWEYVTTDDNDYYLLKGTTTYYQKKQFGVNSQVVQLPYIESIVSDGAGGYDIAGQGLQGYMVGFEQDDSGWTAINLNSTLYNYVDCLTYNGSTVNASPKVGNDVRCYLSTIDAPSTALCYSNEIIVP
jgi:hypothetical protein